MTGRLKSPAGGSGTVLPSPCPMCGLSLVVTGPRSTWEPQMSAHVWTHIEVIPADS